MWLQHLEFGSRVREWWRNGTEDALEGHKMHEETKEFESETEIVE